MGCCVSSLLVASCCSNLKQAPQASYLFWPSTDNVIPTLKGPLILFLCSGTSTQKHFHFSFSCFQVQKSLWSLCLPLSSKLQHSFKSSLSHSPDNPLYFHLDLIVCWQPILSFSYLNFTIFLFVDTHMAAVLMS